MTALVLIPARQGSKGLPGKNLREVAGISLVARAVRTGRRFLAAAGVEGMVVVDTDGDDLAAEGRRWGASVPFLRPAALAADTTQIIDNVLTCLERLARPFDALVLLQPTSPLRAVDDVLACWRAFDVARAPSIVAVTPSEHAPQQALTLGLDGLASWAWAGNASEGNRQGLQATYRPSGAVYVNTTALLRETRSFFVQGVTRGVVMPGERAVDVDSADDLAMADALARRRPPAPLAIAGRAIGPGHPCYVIAEAGVNHCGDVSLAHKLVDVAADAGADAVKFQTFVPELLAARDASKAAYQTANTGKGGSQLDMLRELALSREAHAKLQAHARERGIVFLSTPFDPQSADFLEALGVPAFKMASGELTNHPFIAHVAAKGRPLLLSTGMADMCEVAAAVDAVEAAGNDAFGLFHCVTSYPAAAADANLAAMASMQAAFGRPTGWSDHTPGIELALAATARGASILEKHFTLDKGLPGPDHKASLDPGELGAMVRGVRAVEAAAGDGVKRPRPAELPLIIAARKSLHAARDLAAGHCLRAEDLVALRPGDGIAPSRLASVVGRPLRAALSAGDKLLEGHLG